MKGGISTTSSAIVITAAAALRVVRLITAAPATIVPIAASGAARRTMWSVSIDARVVSAAATAPRTGTMPPGALRAPGAR